MGVCDYGYAGVAVAGDWLTLRATGLYRPHAHHFADKAKHAAKKHHVRWNPKLFASVAIYGLGAAPLAFGLYAAPLYLSHVLHVPQARLGHLLWVPPVGWEVGYSGSGGRLADKRHHDHVQKPLRIFCGLAVICGALGIPALSRRWYMRRWKRGRWRRRWRSSLWRCLSRADLW